MSVAEPKLSATVALMRPASPGFEVLLLRRNANLAFHGGDWVFPGGRVDPDDWQGGSDVLTAARRAAIREAQEEAGLDLQDESLTPFARWTTPIGQPRRYHTWFFAAAISDMPVQIDGGEIHDHRWFRPKEALAARESGQIGLPPPTYVTLTRMLACSNGPGAVQALSVDGIQTYTPRMYPAPEGGMCSVYEADVAYAEGDLGCPGPRHRLWMVDGGWRYERDA